MLLDSELYRETLSEDLLTISNEEDSNHLQLEEASRPEYLSYKSADYYEVKNSLRKTRYSEMNTQCALASVPGVVDLFADSESGRLLVKLHLTSRNGDHFFKLFRSKGSLGRHFWKHVVVQLNESFLKVFFDSVLDIQIDLSDFNILFRKTAENEEIPKEIVYWRPRHSTEFGHNGLLLGNIDRTRKRPNWDRQKYSTVFSVYKSKSLLDKTNLQFFEQSKKVSFN